MTIDEAMHAAIAGGWDFKKAEVGGILTPKAAFIDPVFWKSLGKTLGWEALNDLTLQECGRVAWQQMWVNFIDDLAHGKPADGFFQKLTLQ